MRAQGDTPLSLRRPSASVVNRSALALRAITRSGEPWFVARDVAVALGYRNTADAVRDHVEPEDKQSVSLGLPGKAPILVNESGLYSLIMGSKLPEAKAFKKWVTGEVLPAIRKHGMYLTPAVAQEAIERPEELLARAVIAASNANAERSAPSHRRTEAPTVPPRGPRKCATREKRPNPFRRLREQCATRSKIP